MKTEYDLTRMRKRRNPYAKRLKRQVTLRIGVDILEHFRSLAKETGVPYHELINRQLRNSMRSRKRLVAK